MLIDQDTVNLYQDQGVILVKKIISSNWIKKLKPLSKLILEKNHKKMVSVQKI